MKNPCKKNPCKKNPRKKNPRKKNPCKKNCRSATLALLVLIAVFSASCDDTVPSSSSTGAEPTSSSMEATQSATTAPFPVIFFVVDTLRADHVGLFGNPRDVTPRIDAFAQEAFAFDDAVAQSSWTRPSVASIFTGLEPPLHELDYFGGYLPTSNLTLAEFLKEAGFATEGLIANSIIRSQFGFGQGFDRFVYQAKKSDATSMVDRGLRWIQRLEKQEAPFFFYLHLMDPHLPYDPPAETVAQFASDVSVGPAVEVKEVKAFQREGIQKSDPRVADLLAIYDAEIAHVDRSFGRFLEALKAQGIYDRALIVFTVDHGEAFWDRGSWGHGHDLSPELVHIPLLIKPPHTRSDGRRMDHLASQIDLFRTVADYLGLEVPEFVRGRSLRPLMEGDVSDDEDVAVFAHVSNRNPLGISVTTKNWKLIEPKSVKMGSEPILIDRRADPGEWQNVFDDHPEVAARLLSLLREWEAQDLDWIEPESEDISAEERAELEALGYL